jgi:hypothetical protein
MTNDVVVEYLDKNTSMENNIFTSLGVMQLMAMTNQTEEQSEIISGV